MIGIGPTLEELGITSKPEATLTQQDAFFVLVDDLLVYRDTRVLRSIRLRDLTRIHSDDSGTLRVETPAGAALSASLLGFDPDQVQPFFLRVRDATAYAKAQAKRAQERERGEARPSPFAGVPRAQPEAAPPAPTAPAPQPATPEEFEPYAPYERPRSFGQEVGERLGSVVRVIKRRPETAPAPAPAPEAPAEVAAPQAPQPPAPAQSESPQPPAAQPPATVSMEEALRSPQAIPQSAPQPMPQSVPESAPKSASRPQPVQVPPPSRPASAPVAAPPAAPAAPAAVPVADLRAKPGPSRQREERPQAAEAAEGTPGQVTENNTDKKAATALPDLSVWPPRLRVTAGLLVLAALGLTAYYLLHGMVAAGLWLLAAGGAGAVFLLAAADVVQVLAHGQPRPGEAQD